MPRARSWTFTINNFTEEDVNLLIYISNICVKYIIFGFELGEQGTPHLQGYVQYPIPRPMSYLKTDFPRAHLEIAKGTPQQNIDYCMKDGEYYEFGVRPTKGGRVTFEQIRDAYSDPNNNMTIIRQYAKTYREVCEIRRKQSNDRQCRFYVYKRKNEFDSTDLAYLNNKLQLTGNTVYVETLNDCAAYIDEQIDNIILIGIWESPLLLYYPGNSVPIKIRQGYEYFTLRPANLIIVTDHPSPLLKAGYEPIL